MTIPSIGSFCKYYFKQPFQALNGAYQIVSASSLATAINQNKIDFVASLYKPANLDGSTYETDVTAWTNDDILELVPPGTNQTTIYVPSSILASLPDPTVSRYQNVHVRVPLGYFPLGNAEEYSWLAGQISAVTSAVTAQPDGLAFFADPNDDIYYTTTEYKALDDARKAKVQTILPVQTQLVAAQQTILQLRTQIAALEAIIVAKNAP